MGKIEINVDLILIIWYNKIKKGGKSDVEDLKLQTLLIILGIVVSILNIIKTTLEIVERILNLVAGKNEKRRNRPNGKRRN